jgi:hypothetical protein
MINMMKSKRDWKNTEEPARTKHKLGYWKESTRMAIKAFVCFFWLTTNKTTCYAGEFPDSFGFK